MSSMRSRIWRSSLSVAGALLIAAPVAAQTLFVRPDTTPDYSRYRYLDECMSAIDRLTDDGDRADGVWEDTVRNHIARKNRPRSPSANAAGQACLTGLEVDTITLDSLRFASVVFDLMKMNRDSDALRLLNRIVAANNPDDSLGKMSGLMYAYLHARPIRLPAARTLYDRIVRAKAVDTADPPVSIFVGVSLANAERWFGDAASARQLALRLFKWWDEIPLEKRARSIQLRSLSYSVARLFEWVHEPALMDSLTQSTAAYRRSLMSMWRQLMQDTSKTGVDYLTALAPPLTWDAAFRSTGASLHDGATWGEFTRVAKNEWSQRPVSGRVNLVVFLRGCHRSVSSDDPDWGRWVGNHSCMRKIAPLRRFKERFPDLEITIVTNTSGSVGGADPLPNPSDEADTLAKLFLGFHHIPGTLVVEYTKFWRLPGLDNRRIDEVTDNNMNWSDIGGAKRAPNMTDQVLAIDETGAVFYWRALGGYDGDRVNDRDSEDEVLLEKKLDAVFRRRQQ